MPTHYTLITGANRGIGRQLALDLAAKSHHVVVGCRDAGDGRKVAAEVAASGGEASVVALDVADDATIDAAAAELSGRLPRLDVLVNNAGIFPDEDVDILTVGRDHADRTLQVNTLGPLRVTQAMLPLLRKSEAARVVNVSSGLGQLHGLSVDKPSYCLSKLALNGVTLLLSRALADEAVAVNSVCPGWVRTEMGGADADRSIEEGAAGIVWLATDADASLTGGFFRDGQPIDW